MTTMQLVNPYVLDKCVALEKEIYQNLRNSEELSGYGDDVLAECAKEIACTETEDSTYEEGQGEELITKLECLADEALESPVETIRERVSPFILDLSLVS